MRWYRYYKDDERLCKQLNERNREEQKQVMNHIYEQNDKELEKTYIDFFNKLFNAANITMSHQVPFFIGQKIYKNREDLTKYDLIIKFDYIIPAFNNELIVPEFRNFEIERYIDNEYKENIIIDNPIEYYKNIDL